MKLKKMKEQSNARSKQKTNSKSKKKDASSDGKDAALASMSIDQFLASGLDSDDGSDAEAETPMNGGGNDANLAEGTIDSGGEDEEQEEESSEGKAS